jgi:hypothetical protein
MTIRTLKSPVVPPLRTAVIWVFVTVFIPNGYSPFFNTVFADLSHLSRKIFVFATDVSKLLPFIVKMPFNTGLAVKGLREETIGCCTLL